MTLNDDTGIIIMPGVFYRAAVTVAGDKTIQA